MLQAPELYFKASNGGVTWPADSSKELVTAHSIYKQSNQWNTESELCWINKFTTALDWLGTQEPVTWIVTINKILRPAYLRPGVPSARIQTHKGHTADALIDSPRWHLLCWTHPGSTGYNCYYSLLFNLQSGFRPWFSTLSCAVIYMSIK